MEPVRSRSDGGDHDEDAPKTKHHAWNGGQHLDDEPENKTQACVHKALSEEDRDGQSKKTADQQSQKRAVKGSPHRRRYAELFFLNVPVGMGKELNLVFTNGWQSLPADLPHNIGHQYDYKKCGNHSEAAETAVDKILAFTRRLTDGSG